MSRPRYRTCWPLIGPFAWPESCKTRPMPMLYHGDEFDDLGTPEELARMVDDGMIEAIADLEPADA